MKEFNLYTSLNKLNRNFQRYTNVELPVPEEIKDKFHWLHYEAPFSLLSHDLEGNLTYINCCALSHFKYQENDMLTMPSKYTADGEERERRQKMLQQVAALGVIKGITGPRVDSQGNTFMIYDGIIWNLLGEDGKRIGQAGLVWHDQLERPQWYRISL